MTDTRILEERIRHLELLVKRLQDRPERFTPTLFDDEKNRLRVEINALKAMSGGLIIYTKSIVMDLGDYGVTLIEHNMGTESRNIYAINGDYMLNPFAVDGIDYVDENSFRVRTISGYDESACRINVMILAEIEDEE